MTPLSSRLLAPVDALLNRVTMYRLVTLYLGSLLAVAMLLGWLGRIPYEPADIALTAVIAVAGCVLVNRLFAHTFGAPRNDDSAIITGLIIALIAGPATDRSDAVFIAWAATIAMTSKYVLAWRGMHLFNPAAIALVLTNLVAHESASWWVSARDLTPFVIAGGLLVVRKVRRGDLVFGFLWATFFVNLAWSGLDGQEFRRAVEYGVLASPAWFLAFAMLTEPIGIPPRRAGQLVYGILLGVLAVPQLHLGGRYLTPELALVIGNLGVLPFRSRVRRRFILERAIPLGPGLVDFVYRPEPALAFQPGQYMEWTLDHRGVDGRGTRRYFTLASSPTEPDLRIGVKFNPDGSSYKEAMRRHAEEAGEIVATQVAGDFTLPRDPARKLCFVAGGIGVTPFRSMVKYLADRGERRDVVLLYANRHADEILYRDVFDTAGEVIPFRAVHVLSDPAAAPPDWDGETGHIDAELVARRVPDFWQRLFYVSGPPGMVRSVAAALRELGVQPANIKTDAFSGL